MDNTRWAWKNSQWGLVGNPCWQQRARKSALPSQQVLRLPSHTHRQCMVLDHLQRIIYLNKQSWPLKHSCFLLALRLFSLNNRHRAIVGGCEGGGTGKKYPAASSQPKISLSPWTWDSFFPNRGTSQASITIRLELVTSTQPKRYSPSPKGRRDHATTSTRFGKSSWFLKDHLQAPGSWAWEATFIFSNSTSRKQEDIVNKWR